jgi:hypothetical protein
MWVNSLCLLILDIESIRFHAVRVNERHRCAESPNRGKKAQFRLRARSYSIKYRICDKLGKVILYEVQNGTH